MYSLGLLLEVLCSISIQSRTSDEAAERPLQVRYEQKMAKYGRVAEQNNLRFSLKSKFDTS